MARIKMSPGQAKALATLLGGVGMGVVGGVTEGIVGTIASSELKKREKKKHGSDMHKVAFAVAFFDEMDKLAIRIKKIPAGSKAAQTSTMPQLPTPPSAGSTIPT